ncbi:hypothetical protein VJ923_08235 [Adlercreutzia sp. R25]|uniref:Uncharacterized protein n=1 Tax=Adlercreutzia shanghongiae TaxID=3111773 RepID=A0ABU6J0J6_9ACTN|nr:MULTISPECIES: hypothetical protein [unclassified Adlercreutzia]MEC4273144.1 hypothetical protein [Adlercreutzia sp. R25]MEC4295372.1 hypothetical protein [Adlercreutzia sp. R22]
MKVCPVCESALFDDMETCFGCLYRFGSDPALEAARASTAVLWPHTREAGASCSPVCCPETPSASGGAGGGDAGGGGRFGGADGTGGAHSAGDGGRDDGGDDGGGGDDGRDTREMVVPGWRLRVRAEGPLGQAGALTIEIEPAPGGAGSHERQGELRA